MASQQIALTDFGTARMNRRSMLKRMGVIGLALPSAGMLVNGSAFEPSTADAMERVVPAAVTITARDLAFEPTTLEVQAGQFVTLTFVNTGAMEHDWQVPSVTVADLTVVEPPPTWTARMQTELDKHNPYAGAGAGEQTVVQFTAPVAGSYEFICAVPGHAQAGMKGTLIVYGTSAAAPATDTHAMPTTTASTGTPYDAPRLSNPVIAPPVGAREPQTITQEIEIREVIGYLDEGVAYEFWTFGGTIPGPMLRVRVGDTIELTLKNPAESTMPHNIDLHAVSGPGGGGTVTLVSPGQSASFRFKVLNPGVYVYHCATAPIPHHISSGMYGLIVVEPEGGLPLVDREFYVMQGDFYLDGARGDKGLRAFSMDKLLDERPDYVVFNGAVGSITGAEFTANVGETVRIFFGVGEPNIISSFHVIGEIFDRVMPEGASEWVSNVQTTLVPAGGATIVDFKVEVPGTLLLVDHSLGRLGKGAVGMIEVTGEPTPGVFEVIEPAH